MNLADLRIPEIFNEIVLVYKEYKHRIFDYWSTLSNTSENEVKNQFYEQIVTQLNLLDSKSFVRACIGARILSRYSVSNIEKCAHVYQKIPMISNQNHHKFVNFCISKFSVRFPSSSSFIFDECKNAVQIYQSKSTTLQLLQCQNLLKSLVVNAISFLELYSTEFFGFLSFTLFLPVDNIRMDSYQLLVDFFSYSRRSQIPFSLLEHSEHIIRNENMTKPNLIHGSLLALLAICDQFPTVLMEKSSFWIKSFGALTQQSDPKISTASKILLLTLLTPNDKTTLNTIINMLWTDYSMNKIEDVNSISFIIKFHPKEIVNRELRLFKTLKALIENKESTELVSKGSKLLMDLYARLPNLFTSDLNKISKIFAKATFTEDLINTFSYFVTNIPNFWNEVKVLMPVFVKTCSISSLIKLIVSIPPLEDASYIYNIISTLNQYLNSDDPVIRPHIPAALVKLHINQPLKKQIQNAHQLIQMALKEQSHLMRLAVLTAFKKPYPSFLAYPSFLDLFSVIIKDGNYQVRMEVLRIIGGVSGLNPSMVYPILRRVLLDILFICGSSKSPRLISDATQCLPIIFSTVEYILPVYIPLFISISIKHLLIHLKSSVEEEQESQNNQIEQIQTQMSGSFGSFSVSGMITKQSSYGFLPVINPLVRNNSANEVKLDAIGNPSSNYSKLSFFDRTFSSSIAQSFIDSIACICERDFSLIRSSINDIISIFINSLNNAAKKEIIVSLLNALLIIIKQIGPSETIKIPYLMENLTKLGSRNISSSVHSLIFKIMGQVGPIMPPVVQTIFDLHSESANNINLFLIGRELSYEDYYIHVVISSIKSLLTDNSETLLHCKAHSVIATIFSECTPTPMTKKYFFQYMPSFLSDLRKSSNEEKPDYFQMSKRILMCPTEWLQNYAGSFYQLVEDLYGGVYQIDIINLIPVIAKALKESFSPYIPRITTILLDLLSKKRTDSPTVASLVLHALTELSNFAANFIFIIVRQVVDTIFNVNNSELITRSLNALRSIVQSYDCSTYCSMIIRSCFHVLKNENAAIINSALQVIYSLATTMGPDFKMFREPTYQILNSKGLVTPFFNTISTLTEKKKPSEFPEIIIDSNKLFSHVMNPQREYSFDEIYTKIQLDTSMTNNSWKEWLRQFIYVFIDNSPSRVIHTSRIILQDSMIFARSIFNAAFLSCWMVFDTIEQGLIETIINHAFSLNPPKSVLATLIGIHEFLNRAQKPISHNFFKNTKYALKAEKPTFALRCAILDYDSCSNNSTATMSLIQIYNQLGLYDEAKGLSKISGYSIPDASSSLVRNKTVLSAIKSSIHESEQLMCTLETHEIEEKWEEIIRLYGHFNNLNDKDKKHTALIFAHAFYQLGNYNEFENVLQTNPNSVGSIILKSINMIRKHENVSQNIDDGFKVLGKEAGPLFAHGFSALAPYIVYAQQLTELEEVVRFPKNVSKIWAERISHVSYHFQAIKRLLSMRIEILNQEHDLEAKLAFLRFARHSNEYDIFNSFFAKHFANDKEASNPLVVFEKVRLLWKQGNEIESMKMLDMLITTGSIVEQYPELYSRLLFLKGKWIAQKRDQTDIQSLIEIRSLCSQSLKQRSDHYRATNLWAWSSMNLFFAQVHNWVDFAIESINAYSKCVFLHPESSFSDMLQLSSVLFRSSSSPQVYESTKNVLNEIPLKSFLSILPQLMVYQYTHSVMLREFVKSLLASLLNMYPNGVIFPLIFTSKFGTESSVVQQILSEFKANHTSFYESAEIIHQGLTNACVTLAEFLSDSLYVVLESYRTDRSFSEVIRVVCTCVINRLKSSTSCEYDSTFIQRYQSHIKTLNGIMNDVISKESISSVQFNELVMIQKTFAANLSSEKTLSLPSLAPALFSIKNSPISVFGTFKPNTQPITIKRFGSELGVILSKQRPKQLKIVGNDGHQYLFLLKGREDLRLDQRVMQFFELVNSISPLSIPRITITSISPLTPSAGLIQWIPGCDTISELINEYRQINGINLSLEQSLLQENSCDAINSLLPIHRLEALEVVCSTTKGDDLKNIMWLKSLDTESWVSQTINFSKTSALMSIVGYTIGLGDRHPSNIMIQRFSGSVIHIDFGDCFEVTAERAQLAEKIPFRLTRMMQAALGPSGVEGSFRTICQETIRTLREHREEVMSVLEIFFREPLTKPKHFNYVSQIEAISGSLAITDLNLAEKNEDHIQIMKIMNRIADKIKGSDIGSNSSLTVPEQVDYLISEATNNYNLASLYQGWNPLW